LKTRCDGLAPDLPRGPRAGEGRPRPRVSPITSAKYCALSVARCERVTAVAGATAGPGAHQPEEPAPDLPRGPRAVAGRRPRVSPVRPARSARGRGNDHCPLRAGFPQLRVPQGCCGAGKYLERLHYLRSLMLQLLQSGTLAAEDMRWLLATRTVVIGSNSQGNCDYVLEFIKVTGTRIQTV